MLRRSRRRSGFALEALEPRLALSATGPTFPSLDPGVGIVRTPGEVAVVRNTIPRENLAAHKHATIIGLNAAPTPGSRLDPRIVGSKDAAGRKLPFQAGSPRFHAWHPFARGYAKVANPGAVDIGATGRHGTTGAVGVSHDLPGDLNLDGKVDLTDLQFFQSAYLTTPLDAFYNPAADANKNGFVGHGDAKILLRNLTPLTPKIPLNVGLALAPGEYAHGTNYMTSGGVTRQLNVTVVGRTTPGSLVFADSGLGDYTFTGPVAATDANGNFSFNYTLRPDERLTNTEYLIMDPFGQQLVRDFPIFLVTD